MSILTPVLSVSRVKGRGSNPTRLSGQGNASTKAVPIQSVILGRKVIAMNEDEKLDFQEDSSEKAKVWMQDNLRVIVSVFIVAAIALGIYSYSDRNNNIAEEIGVDEVGSGSTTESEATTDSSAPTADTATGTITKPAVPAELSKETETAFIESAAKGEGSTHLARRALANYLEKNPDSSLSKEHKIYIEDFLRKNTQYAKGGVHPGTSIEFSKSLIEQGIAKSKTLNERQLENLKKYSARAPSLT